MRNPITESLIAPCGMNCALCKAHLRANNSCPGCNYIKQSKYKTIMYCRLRLCSKRKSGFCYDCAEFPCARLKHLDERYRKRYGMSEVENLQYIRDYGMEKFLARERKKWLNEKGIFCVHDHKYYKSPH